MNPEGSGDRSAREPRGSALAAGALLLILTWCTVGMAGRPVATRALGLAAPFRSRSSESTVLLTGVYYDTYRAGEPDEAVRLANVGLAADLAGWTMSDGASEGTVTLTGSLPAGASIWIAREADDFLAAFGFSPDFEYGADTDPAVPNLWMTGSFLLANGGDEVVLRDQAAALVDSVVYEGGNPAGTGWLGEPVLPYRGEGGHMTGSESAGAGITSRETEAFGVEGQILYRKLDQATGMPVPDTDTAADWAQATDDGVNGKKVQYPGWDLERYFFTQHLTETATLTYAVAPDNLYETVLAEIGRARSSIIYEGYTFHNAHLAEAIVAAMQANPGMAVRILLDGGPVGGITDQERWICQQIEGSGGEVYFMVTDDSTDVHSRYLYQHGKWMIVDGQRLLTGSENLTYSSMPADDKSDGTLGNRGVWLITDAPGVVAHAMDVFEHELDPERHGDIRRWSEGDPIYGAPPPGFSPDYSSGGSLYPIQFPNPLSLTGTFSFEVVQSPENSLRDRDSLLGMISRAEGGDSLLVQQLYEDTWWGPAESNPGQDPNLRLEAYIQAARRGARTRILLDAFYAEPGDPRGNYATCTYANSIAASEGLDLECRTGNPTGTGIHNKMVLVWDGQQGWVHLGSINGSETSSKGNRELAVQVQSDAAYAYLATVFWHDWAGDLERREVLPLILRSGAQSQVNPGGKSLFPQPPCEEAAAQGLCSEDWCHGRPIGH